MSDTMNLSILESYLVCYHFKCCQGYLYFCLFTFITLYACHPSAPCNHRDSDGIFLEKPRQKVLSYFGTQQYSGFLLCCGEGGRVLAMKTRTKFLPNEMKTTGRISFLIFLSFFFFFFFFFFLIFYCTRLVFLTSLERLGAKVLL